MLISCFPSQLFENQSVVEYWENFASHAFESTTQSVVSHCVLLKPNGAPVPCTFCFSIRRDIMDLPSIIIGEYFPTQRPNNFSCFSPISVHSRSMVAVIVAVTNCVKPSVAIPLSPLHSQYLPTLQLHLLLSSLSTAFRQRTSDLALPSLSALAPCNIHGTTDHQPHKHVCICIKLRNLLYWA